MSLENILAYTQIGTAIILIVTILLQQRGSGLGGAIGGSSMEFSTKRGLEKGLFTTSVVVAIIFVAVSIYRLILPA